MDPIQIRVRDNGPLVVTGPLSMTDSEGHSLSLPEGKGNIALCRCGASANKPFCDGSHRSSGFTSVVRAERPD